MIRKILIANRGEITCRIIRTCRDMGIATVAVYSDIDATALHVESADEAVALGGNTASESYLNIEKIITAAQMTGADAIHPGYGFLAENSAFAQAVMDAGLIWIGPPVSAIEAMGKKREAKLMLKGVPLVPGYEGDDQSDDALIKAAENIGYPIMVKASAGGGGKGMRRVDVPANLPEELATARREAKQAFGDDTLILEKLVENPRHIEVQIFGDGHGKVIALGERECSIQRRHQKIIEEAPSPFLDPALRKQICEVAVSIGEQLGYSNAGTVEFLVDSEKNFYFMEMNTRLQVEHPVTESVYGVDLVRWQILAADPDSQIDLFGTYWRYETGEIPPNRHAIEVRVYAEDPDNGFLPSTGTILDWSASGQRVDSGIRTGDEITIHYDPMIAKIIAWGDTRTEAIRKLDYALANTRLLGVRNNIQFLRRVLTHADFIAGETTTQFIDAHPELHPPTGTIPAVALVSAAISHQRADSHSANGLTQWRNNPNRPIKHTFSHGDRQYEILLTPGKSNRMTVVIDGNSHDLILPLEKDGFLTDGQLTLILDGHRQHVFVAHNADVWWVHTQQGVYQLLWQTPLPIPGKEAVAEGSLRAPMPGQIISVRVEKGQQVEAGAILMTLEAMKMEHRIQAPYHGVVGKIHYAVGDSVQSDSVLLEVEKTDSTEA
ncbi:MAG: biotin carboxylase N-terminal domain-containing protein [Aggregatilineales bacterium]